MVVNQDFKMIKISLVIFNQEKLDFLRSSIKSIGI